MKRREPLYTRQDLRDLTDVPDAALNYFSREGLLVAAKGGGGRGDHRRFNAVEVLLARLFYDLQQAGGAKMSFLRELSADFHHALQVVSGSGISASELLEKLDRSQGGGTDDVIETALAATGDPLALREAVYTALALNAPATDEFDLIFRREGGRWTIAPSDSYLVRAADGAVATGVRLGRMSKQIWGEE